MAVVVVGRNTHRWSGELVVFHIGMTFNKWWRADLWWPVFRVFRPMLQELEADPESGMLGYELLFGSKGPYVTQYWSSVDKLYEYASQGSLSHRPAWMAFNKMARAHPSAVGIWHETFVVERAESMYVGTKPMGLPKATEIVSVGRSYNHARARLRAGATTAGPDSPPDTETSDPAEAAGH